MLSEDESWYLVSFRLSGDRLDLHNVELKLAIKPDYMGRKGEHFRGNPRYAKHDTNIWIWTLPSDDECPFENQIPSLLDILETKASELRSILMMTDVQGEVLIAYASGSGQGGTELSAHTLGRISALGLMLTLDLYPPTIDEGWMPYIDCIRGEKDRNLH